MEKNNKYGLQLRVKPQQPKKPPLSTPLLFRDDNGDDDVEKEISRQASKNKSLKDIEAMHKKALEEDPSAFDYDGVYDEMKHKVAQPRLQDSQDRKPKYIEALMRKAEVRQREHEIIYERKLAKERTKDDHLYADKDKFVTSAYKKKLAEQAKWMEEERLRQLKEEKEDVTKKSDLSDFYFNLGKNVAFGAKEMELRKQEKETELRNQEKQTEVTNAEKLNDEASASAAVTDSSLAESESSRAKEEDADRTLPSRRSSEPMDVTLVSDKRAGAETEEPVVNQPKRDHHKRNEDEVAKAKERFLARKKAKLQF